jgi:hypothetical protein
MRATTEAWESLAVQVLRWVLLVPMGVGFLWLVERLLDLVIDWALDWRPDGVIYFAVFVGGGLVLLLTMILAALIVRNLTLAIAPRARIGLLLVGIFYTVLQLVGAYRLFYAYGPTWPHTTMKLEFALVVGLVFLLAYRSADE